MYKTISMANIATIIILIEDLRRKYEMPISNTLLCDN